MHAWTGRQRLFSYFPDDNVKTTCYEKFRIKFRTYCIKHKALKFFKFLFKKKVSYFLIIVETPARGDYTLKNDGPVGRNISKYDLAEILVNCLTDDTRVGHTVGMGYVSA
jgi:hypothetical protein